MDIRVFHAISMKEISVNWFPTLTLLLQQEEEHLKQALTRFKYPASAMNKVKMKTKATPNKNSRGIKNSNNNIQKPYMVTPYYKGISESIKKTCSKHGVQVYFKGGNTIKNLLVAPKDQDTIQKKSGVIYRYKCDRVGCNEEYIGETSRTVGKRFKEHLKAPSPIYDHFKNHWSQYHYRKFEHSGEGGPEPQQIDKRSIIHKGQ